MQTHKDLDVWKEGIDLVVEVYKITANYPREEQYGLSSQLRRAAVSMPSNIAEGYARNNLRERIQFLYHSLSSLSEVETQLIISSRLGYLEDEKLIEAVTSLRKRLIRLIQYYKNQNK